MVWDAMCPMGIREALQVCILVYTVHITSQATPETTGHLKDSL